MKCSCAVYTEFVQQHKQCKSARHYDWIVISEGRNLFSAVKVNKDTSKIIFPYIFTKSSS